MHSVHAAVLGGFIETTPSFVAQAVRRNHVADSSRAASAAEPSPSRMGELSSPEQKVFDILQDFHRSPYAFRVVVVGNGAILETTSRLGPVFKVSQQPTTGSNLLTMANDDQSFEFHVRLNQVSKIVLTTRETPLKTLRIARFLNSQGDSICSLILADASDEAIQWYRQLQETYGSDIQL